MASATRPTAFPYKSSQPTSDSERGVSGAIRGGLHFITSLIHEKPALRQEVPVERWCYHYRADITPMTVEDLKERGYALLFTLEGAVRAAIEVVQIVIAKYFTKEVIQETRHSTIFDTQLHSVRLTAWAFVDPNAVKKHIQTPAEDGKPVLGCLESEMEWGTPYDGELTIPLSTNYNWR